MVGKNEEKTRQVLPTNCSSLDRLLDGGLPFYGVSLVYGEAETGKTSLAIQCAVNSARMGYKVIFIDSDGTFSTERFSQIAHHDSAEISPFIILIKPKTLQEQGRAIDNLNLYFIKSVGLVVVDTITSLYRLELGGAKETFGSNRELNGQVASLTQFAKTHKVATLLTSQVRNVFVKEQSDIQPVAARVLKLWSDIVFVLKHTGRTGIIEALIEKHPKQNPTASCCLSIERTGIRDHSH